METLKMRRRILLVEDEPGLALMLIDMLKGEGYIVEGVANGLQATERIVTDAFDLVILDVILPGMNGFDVCRNVRTQGVQTPILMLTARGETTDKVHGLRLGADDYLSKPFDPHELLARVEALLRRVAANNRAGELFQFGDIKVNFNKARVLRSDQKIPLSEREFALLSYLIGKKGSVVTRNELLVHVWDYSAESTTRTVDVHIAMLRQKLERDARNPEFILTVHAQGYRFVG